MSQPQPPKTNKASEIPQLYVHLIEAQGLGIVHSQGTIRCVVKVGDLELRSTPKRAYNPYPKWKKEEFVFQVRSHESVLQLSFWNEDRQRGNTVNLGETNIPLITLETEEPKEDWFTLTGGKEIPTIGRPPDTRVRLLLHYTFSKGTDFGAGIALTDENNKKFVNLLLRPDLEFPVALCESIDAADGQRVSQSLVKIFNYHNRTPELLKGFITREVQTTESSGTLFRSNSLAIKMVSSFSQMVGQQYLRSLLGQLIRGICLDVRSVEVDPTKLKPTDNVQENSQHLLSIAQTILDRVLSSIPQTPLPIREVCTYFSTIVKEKFPNHWQIAIGGFFFLRFLCPACVAPEGCQIVTEPPQPDTRRALVLVTKVLQNLANGQEFTGKEEYMKFANGFISSNLPAIQNFFAKLAEPAQTPSPKKKINDDLENTANANWNLGISPSEVLNDICDLHRRYVTHKERILRSLPKTNTPTPTPHTPPYILPAFSPFYQQQQTPSLPPPTIPKLTAEEISVAIDKFVPPPTHKVTKLHNITSTQLAQLGAVKIVTLNDSDKSDNSPVLERRKEKEDECIINLNPPWARKARDASEVACDLVTQILTLYNTHSVSFNSSTLSNTADSRWSHILTSDQWAKFNSNLPELQRVDLTVLTPPSRVAFFINLFNTLSLHLVILSQGNVNTGKRTSLSMQYTYKYRVNGHDYSIQDILNGILRGNPKSHLTRHRQLRGWDPRRDFTLPPPIDPRIHFAISYLTTTCPYILTFYPNTIEEDLYAAGVRYCEDHVTVDEKKASVILPDLFKNSDFSTVTKGGKDDLLVWLFQFLSTDIRMKVLALMEKKGGVSITYLPPTHELQTPKELPSSPTDATVIPRIKEVEKFQQRVRSNTMGVATPQYLSSIGVRVSLLNNDTAQKIPMLIAAGNNNNSNNSNNSNLNLSNNNSFNNSNVSNSNNSQHNFPTQTPLVSLVSPMNTPQSPMKSPRPIYITSSNGDSTPVPVLTASVGTAPLVIPSDIQSILPLPEPNPPTSPYGTRIQSLRVNDLPRASSLSSSSAPLTPMLFPRKSSSVNLALGKADLTISEIFEIFDNIETYLGKLPVPLFSDIEKVLRNAQSVAFLRSQLEDNADKNRTYEPKINIDAKKIDIERFKRLAGSLLQAKREIQEKLIQYRIDLNDKNFANEAKEKIANLALSAQFALGKIHFVDMLST